MPSCNPPRTDGIVKRGRTQADLDAERENHDNYVAERLAEQYHDGHPS